MATKPKTTTAATGDAGSPVSAPSAETEDAAEATAGTSAATKQSGGAAEDTRGFRVLSPIRFDGQHYAPGAMIALTDAHYQQLRTSGAIDPEPITEAQDAGQH